MSEQADDGKTLAPWEIPPDESYWRALLAEGEFGAGTESEIAAPQAAALTIPEEDVLLVAQQTGVSMERAKNALRDAEGDLAKAILMITTG